MCQRHSFAVTKAARVIDGLGLTDSHTRMLDMAGLSASAHDERNLYEWQPPKGWPDASWLEGLTRDSEVFTPKKSHDKVAEAHLRALYPTLESWNAGDTIRWESLDFPDVDRVHRVYDLALQAAPLAKVSDGEIITAVDEHLRRLGVDVRVTEVVDAASVRASVRASVWDSVRASVWDSVWDSVRASLESSMVAEDGDNAFLPILELATKGAYLYGVTDEGVAYVWREAAE